MWPERRRIWSAPGDNRPLMQSGDEPKFRAFRSAGPQSGAPEIGAVAQLGERLNGIQEVRGSIPLGSTMFPKGFLSLANCGVGAGLPPGYQLHDDF